MGIGILDLNKLGCWPCPGEAGHFTIVQTLWNCLLSLGPSEMQSEQMIKLNLGTSSFLGPGI